MKSIYTQLYEGLEAIDKLIDKEDEISADSPVFALEDELEAELPDEMKEKFREVLYLYEQKDRQSSQAIFERGVKLGMQLMLDAIIERELAKKDQ